MKVIYEAFFSNFVQNDNIACKNTIYAVIISDMLVEIT